MKHAAKHVEELSRYQLDMALAPERFLDPILHTVMRDPVILPTSRITVDRSVIMRHLLSDPTDPFNRQSLTVEQLIPDDLLKAEIEAYEAKRDPNGDR